MWGRWCPVTRLCRRPARRTHKVQRLVELLCMLAPLRRIHGEDAADRDVGDVCHMAVRLVQAGSGAYRGEPRGLDGIAQGSELGMLKALYTAQGPVGICRTGIQGCLQDRQDRERERLTPAIEDEEKARHARIAAGNLGKDAQVKDIWRRDRVTALGHVAGSAAAWRSMCARTRAILP